ncbi:hydrogen peroxide-dependent heme synthase [Nocardioides sp.]|uniref:hydrogen peroxide-dependent heme synthase n=1 Tax=Nocardioides sp. TaxID=35761 RepID=UPI00260C3B05|nr:hydrogen peroxide-dependent heme synthase [Nocardioides sp.]
MSETSNDPQAHIKSNAARINELNDAQRYTMWSVFKVERPIGADAATRDAEAAELEEFFTELAGKDVVLRGIYDVAGLRADADLMIWWHATTSDELQEAYHALRRTAFGSRLAPVWSQMALHRPAEFNRSHLPAFLADERAHGYVAVYPFVRSYEWYLLEETERRRLLAEHGQMGRDYPDVRANTVQSFALGDYEWILAFEADDLGRIVDLMRHLRASETRRHVREEVPFYTGRRIAITDLVTVLP